MTMMLNRCLLALALMLLAGCAALPAGSRHADPQALVGTWQVDLRMLPGDPPYLQTLVVRSVEGQAFSGSFYGAPLEQARINTDWGALRLAFVTSDASGPYHHSAVLEQGRLQGMSHSIGRNFLSVWSATKP